MNIDLSLFLGTYLEFYPSSAPQHEDPSQYLHHYGISGWLALIKHPMFSLKSSAKQPTTIGRVLQYITQYLHTFRATRAAHRSLSWWNWCPHTGRHSKRADMYRRWTARILFTFRGAGLVARMRGYVDACLCLFVLRRDMIHIMKWSVALCIAATMERWYGVLPRERCSYLGNNYRGRSTSVAVPHFAVSYRSSGRLNAIGADCC